MADRQSQRAGDKAIQIAADGSVIFGIDEARAREISLESAREVLAQHSSEAHDLIQDRIFKLDDRIIAALVRSGRMEVFAEPSFQRAYKKAQSGAAATERESDYDMLAALLADRAERGAQRIIRFGIERSLEIIDQVDDGALTGLTAIQALIQYMPTGGDIEVGIDIMERLLNPLVEGELPEGDEWIDHLDILDAVRPTSSTEFKKFQDFYPERVPGYCAAGRPAEEPARIDIVEVDGTTWPFGVFLQSHVLNPGHVRLAAVDLPTFEKYMRSFLPAPAADAYMSKAESDWQFGAIDSAVRERFMESWNARPTLARLSAWWNRIPKHFGVTPVGRVLARANAVRLDREGLLPAID